MSSTYVLETDVKEALAMAEGLEDYVRGDNLYGNADGGFFSKLPSLTVGALLMRLRRLDVLRGQLQDRQRKRLDAAIDRYDNVRHEWAHHYEQKMLQEAHSRLNTMSNFFQECAESVSKCAGAYRPELLRRTIVQEIVKEIGALKLSDEDLMVKVRAADSKLHGVLRPDSFQWAGMLRPAYPEAEFWWLYQKPPQTEG